MAVKDHPIETSQASTPRRRITGLDWLILAGLVASFVVFFINAVQFAALFIAKGEVVPPTIITSVASVLLAIAIAVTLSGRRWSFIITLVVTVLCVLGLNNPYIFFTLTHPSSNLFGFVTFATVFASSALILGVTLVKIIRMRQGQPNEISRSMMGFTGLMAGMLVGVLLLGFMVQGSSGTGAVTLRPKNENVSVQGGVFAPDIVALHTGDTLTISDVDGVHHILTNGTWSADNKPVPGVEPGAVLISNLNVDNGSVTVGPFTTPGTYHIYCTVHPGMRLTVVVQ
jgi:plastocyanin